MSESNYTNLLNYLFNCSHGHNPFSISTNFFPKITRYPKNDVILDENEIRCPICLQLAFKPVHPNNCKHVFCKTCILLWCKNKFSCPICRISFCRICEVDLYDYSFDFQGSLFA